MKRLSAGDLKNLNLLKHYRIIRKWACKNNGLTDADLELLIYLDCIDMFTINDFKIGTYSYSWDNRRWNKLIQNNLFISFFPVDSLVVTSLLMRRLGFDSRLTHFKV